MKKEKRKNIIKAYITDDEYNEISESCSRSGLSISTFIQRVCLGSIVPSREDAQARRELLKVNADLGRLGGLLKQAITTCGEREKIRPLLKEIEILQLELKEKVKAIQ